MFINDKTIEEYDAKLLDRQISPSKRDIFSFWSGKNINPYTADTEYGYKELSLDIEFKGAPREIEINKNGLLAEIEKSTIKFRAIDRYYSGHIASHNIKRQVNGFEVITIVMDVIEHEKEKEIDSNKSQEFQIELASNFITPAILEVRPTIDLVDVEITGLGEDILLKNLTAYKTIVINGEEGYVTEQGENKYNDYDSWGFPYLSPGTNIITVNKKTVDLKIKYKPRWV